MSDDVTSPYSPGGSLGSHGIAGTAQVSLPYNRYGGATYLERHVVSTSAAPAAIGPYSQAVFAQGKFFFISGQIGMKADGSMATGIEDQTRQVIMNLRAILFAGGLDPGDLVKTTIYLTDMSDFAAVNEIYSEMVGSEPPARATVQVSALPKGALVEIDAIAIAPV